MKKRLLFFVPSRLGDALMITPALALLKKIRPAYDIDIFAASALGASVYQNNIHSDKIYVAKDISNLAHFFAAYRYAIVCHQGQVMNSGIKFPIPMLIMNTATSDKPFAEQALEFIQSILEQEPRKEMGKYAVYPSDADIRFADKALPPDKKFIGIHLGCHGINKKNTLLKLLGRKTHEKAWPLPYFIELARLVSRHHPEYTFVLTGSAGEELLAKEFMSANPNSINIVGKTNVLELAAVMKRLSAYVCNDTGTMHLSCAVEIPLLTLFLPAIAKRTGPYPSSDFRIMLQAPDLEDIKPEVAFIALEKLLATHKDLNSMQ